MKRSFQLPRPFAPKLLAYLCRDLAKSRHVQLLLPGGNERPTGDIVEVEDEVVDRLGVDGVVGAHGGGVFVLESSISGFPLVVAGVVACCCCI